MYELWDGFACLFTLDVHLSLDKETEKAAKKIHRI